MSLKFLEYNGLVYFWQKLKAYFVSAVSYNSSTRKISVTKNGTSTDLVTIPDDRVFWATYGSTTTADIEAAYQAGKVVLVAYDPDSSGTTLVYRLEQRASSTTHLFYAMKSPKLNVITVTSNSWFHTVVSLLNSTSLKTVTGTSLVGTGDVLPSAVGYTTTVPSAANTSGLKFVLCDSEPSTKYDGWVYLIKES